MRKLVAPVSSLLEKFRDVSEHHTASKTAIASSAKCYTGSLKKPVQVKRISGQLAKGGGTKRARGTEELRAGE